MSKHEVNQFSLRYSTQNTLDSKTLWAMFAPVALHTRIATEAGYQDGVEFMPFHLPSLEVRLGILTARTLDLIQSAHQSYRSERSIRDFRTHPRKDVALKAALALPDSIYSLTILARLRHLREDRCHLSLPFVLYPLSERDRVTSNQVPDNSLFEPSPELLEKWRVDNISQLGNEGQKRGYAGFCLDLYHLRRNSRRGSSFGDWRNQLQLALPWTKEIHLSLGRTDFNGIDSMAELKDVIYGTRQTDIIPILEAIKKLWTGPIVTEIPSLAISKLLFQGKLISPRNLITAHAQIVQNLGQILA